MQLYSRDDTLGALALQTEIAHACADGPSQGVANTLPLKPLSRFLPSLGVPPTPPPPKPPLLGRPHHPVSSSTALRQVQIWSLNEGWSLLFWAGAAPSGARSCIGGRQAWRRWKLGSSKMVYERGLRRHDGSSAPHVRCLPSWLSQRAATP